MIREYDNEDSTQITQHFKANEFQCKCGKTHKNLISDELVQKLEQLRDALGCSSIQISSGYRCIVHDKAVGGSGTGQHTKGKAADICCFDKNGKAIDNKIVCCTAQEIGFTGIARIAGNGTYTHVDVRAGKWYGDETKGMSYCIPCNDFYEYFGIERSEEMSPLTSGIDVSAHQGKIEWSKVKADFAILRAGYGKVASQKDKQFEANYNGAKAAGIPVGAYWYSYAKTADEAKQEATVCLEVLKGKQFEYPIYFDVEDESQLALGKAKVSEIIRAFLTTLEKAGYWVGLYMSASPLSTHVDDDIKKRYAVWVANVGVTKPAYTGDYGMWQYSWHGNLAGIAGDTDLDYCYVDYPAKIKSKGLNGYSKQPEQPIPESKYFEITVDGKTYSGNLTLK